MRRRRWLRLRLWNRLVCLPRDLCLKREDGCDGAQDEHSREALCSAGAFRRRRLRLDSTLRSSASERCQHGFGLSPALHRETSRVSDASFQVLTKGETRNATRIGPIIR